MSRLWKDLRTNWMYWRFRNITRNRIRLKNWWGARRRGGLRPQSPYRFRGTASAVYYRSPRRTWAYLLGLVIALTALSAAVQNYYVNPSIVYLLGTLMVVGAVYLALRGT